MQHQRPGHPSTMLFDLDGTLIDTAPDFIAVLERLCKEDGRTPPAAAAVNQTVSSGARALVALAWELEESAAGFDQLHQRLLAAYDEQLDDTHSILYPGMPALLDWLEATEIPWGIVTNKPLQYSNKLLSNMALLERCPVLVCPDHVSRRKPDPESLHLACHQLDCASEHGIYVGDHPRDIEAGRAAGMFTIAAAYGYLPPAPAIAQWQADHIVNSATDILHWIQSQTRTTA